VERTALAIVQSPPASRVILHQVSWQTYQGLLRDHESRSTPRFAYDNGTLEIMTPLPDHEQYSRFIEFLLAVVEEETGTKVYNFGSTTFSREDLQKGFEADTCFYIAHASHVRGKPRLDLHTDPPPDLVVEIDITHPSLEKLPIYAQIGVPEVWRYAAGRMEILLLEGDAYRPAPQSRAVPVVTTAALSRLVDESTGLSQGEWLRQVRAWLHGGTGIGGKENARS